MATIELYDTTLRDGTQMEGISLSVEDKLKIAAKLDELGVHYIEGGYPGSNPKDAEFFARARSLGLKNARLAAFGSTRRAGASVKSDASLKTLVEAGTSVVTIVGKAHDRHVTHVLETTLEENLAMIGDSVRYLKSHGLTVFFDAEHYFDGFASDRDYALQCLKTAAGAGADCVVLCDTNGGTVTSAVRDVVSAAVAQVSCPVGIHAHNGADLAVANTMVAIEAGATHVQAAVNGYGDMCGNANMMSVIANLKLKMGLDVVTDGQLGLLTEVSRYVSEIANLPPNPRQPYVGTAAFAHKAGLHTAALAKEEWSYQHVDPAAVGNDTRILISELGGSRGILTKLQERGIKMERREAQRLLEQVKLMESRGYQYEGAEASFEVLVHRSRPGYRPPFELEDFMVVERRHHGPGEREMLSEAMVKIRVGDEVVHTAAEGNGPVNALDAATRKALVQFYPTLGAVKLVDYKVRIIDTAAGTGASVRVLIESTDGDHSWTTVGASTDIIEASWLALADSLEYWLTKTGGPAR
ncbi:MAG: citramalate synthase [Chloroflexi bacterium]|nr:citramalate synthase [Chloroflexota bacterium]